MNLDASLIIAVISLSISCYLITNVIRNHIRVKKMKEWLEIKGIVTDNYQKIEGSGEDAVLVQIIIYSYQIDGHYHKNTLKFDYHNVFGLNQHIAILNKGKMVKILYDGSNPGNSVLKSYNQDMIYIPLVIIALLFLIGILSMLIHIE